MSFDSSMLGIVEQNWPESEWGMTSKMKQGARIHRRFGMSYTVSATETIPASTVRDWWQKLEPVHSHIRKELYFPASDEMIIRVKSR